MTRTDTRNATHKQLVDRAVELMRLFRSPDYITDKELRANAESAGNTLLRYYIEYAESEIEEEENTQE